ncbi:MAG: pitrilysin family protein [Fibrobacteraceae bacterium]
MLKQKILKTVLPNGITVLTDYMPCAYSATVGAWIPRGSRHEVLENNGLSHFYEHLVFKGTENRTALEIAHAIEDRGGNLEAYTTRQETGFYAQVVKEDVALALDVISDMLMNPLFDAKEMEKERKVIIEEIHSYDDIAEECVGDIFNEIHYKGCGLALPIAGTVKSVRELTREGMLEYERQVIEDLPLLVCAAGKVDHEKLVELVQKFFSKKTSAKKPFDDLYAANTGIKAKSKKELNQSSVFWGTSFDSVNGMEFSRALGIFNVAFGGDMGSRLFQKIREELGLAYSVYSMTDVYRNTLGWGVSFATDPQKADMALSLAKSELEKFLKNGFEKGELERTKKNIIGGLHIGADSTEKRLMRLADQTLHFGRFYTMAETEKEVKSFTEDRILCILQKLFEKAPFATAVVKPAE